MKNLLKLEELAQFLLCVLFLVLADVAWWVYPILLLGPDIGMLGYLANARVGAWCYNMLHHKGVAVLVLFLAFTIEYRTHALGIREGLVPGTILFGHASMDRIFGYGLKFGDSFQHTHLGWIGKLKGGE